MLIQSGYQLYIVLKWNHIAKTKEGNQWQTYWFLFYFCSWFSAEDFIVIAFICDAIHWNLPKVLNLKLYMKKVKIQKGCNYKEILNEGDSFENVGYSFV